MFTLPVRGIAALAVCTAILLGPSMASAATLTRQLDLGMSGADVSQLQTYLALDSTIYPQGLVTGYFGTLTKAAVMKFQSQNGIMAVGRVGPVTLAALNARMGGGTTPPTDMSSAPLIYGVMVSTSSTNATVSWSTNKLAKGVVYYDVSPLTEYEYLHTVSISGNMAMMDETPRMTQSVTIVNLLPNTTYYYDIYVTDTSGNVSMTMQSSFRTAP